MLAHSRLTEVRQVEDDLDVLLNECRAMLRLSGL